MIEQGSVALPGVFDVPACHGLEHRVVAGPVRSGPEEPVGGAVAEYRVGTDRMDSCLDKAQSLSRRRTDVVMHDVRPSDEPADDFCTLRVAAVDRQIPLPALAGN